MSDVFYEIHKHGIIKIMSFLVIDLNLGSGFLVLGSWFLVLESWFWVLGSGFMF